MCGIAGILAYANDQAPVDRSELRAIRDHMAARGPDGVGEWLSDDGRLGLGHRRLSIIDLSERAAQPMLSADGRLAVVFNGEIYNFKALRQALKARGCSFRTASDTEVLLHLYAEHGDGMLEHLRGMFAFALWDGPRRRLLLARDPYGIKPLYIADDGQTLRFASQVKALLAGGGISTQTDPAGEAGFYLFGSVPEPLTCYCAIRALPAGCALVVEGGRASLPRAYARLAEAFSGIDLLAVAGASSAGGAAERQARIRAALLDSVRDHLVADVPVGAFLSAGVDSGALVGLMRDAGQSEIQTLTLAFDEFSGRADDEAPLAARVAAQYGTRHHTRRVSHAEFLADLPHILTAMDQPSIDGINTWFVSKATREQGLKVAVSGLGGDELFGGYPAFRELPRWVRWLGPATRLPGLGRSVRRLGTGLLAKRLPALSAKAYGLLEYGGTYPGAWLLRRGLFMPWELPALMGAARAQAALERLRPLQHIASVLAPEPPTPFGRVAVLESALYMRNQLLRDSDWAGMAHGLEIRTPLVDFELLRHIAPLMQRHPEAGKAALAHSPSQPLPAQILERPKTGFGTPIAAWMEVLSQMPGAGATAQPVVDRFAPKTHDAASRVGHWSRRWAVQVLAQHMGANPLVEVR